MNEKDRSASIVNASHLALSVPYVNFSGSQRPRRQFVWPYMALVVFYDNDVVLSMYWTTFKKIGLT